MSTREKDIAAALAHDPLDHHADIFVAACAHRDRQVVAFLRAEAERAYAAGEQFAVHALNDAAKAIERGEHVP